MRFTALDFLPGRDSAVAATWSGDVWRVDGLDGDLDELIWTRIAAGLSQPLGIRVRDGEVFVLGRDQITRLHDLDGDGVTNFYENFNADTMNSEHFHEPASGLQTDAAGNFYFLKAARHAKDAVHPHHGVLVKVSANGAESTVLASGFRAPNGLAVEADGSFFGSDQEGHWMPANRINRIVPGGFYGNKWTGGEGRDREDYDPPLTWVHPTVDRSPSSQIRVNMPSWGDLNGRLLGLSYGTGEVYLILEDEVDGVHQGGIVKLPIKVPTGLMSGRFNPADGHLYLAGLVGWSSDATEDGGLYRVRSTGPLPPLADEVRAMRDGLVLHLTQPLDESATELSRWEVSAWNYLWSERYGSPDLKLGGGEGRTVLPVQRVVRSDDGRTIWLHIPTMQTAMQMQVDAILPVGGVDHETQAHLSVHRLHDRSGRESIHPDVVVGCGARAVFLQFQADRRCGSGGGQSGEVRRRLMSPCATMRLVRPEAMIAVDCEATSQSDRADSHTGHGQNSLRIRGVERGGASPPVANHQQEVFNVDEAVVVEIAVWSGAIPVVQDHEHVQDVDNAVTVGVAAEGPT
jgi:hypothetical protein